MLTHAPTRTGPPGCLDPLFCPALAGSRRTTSYPDLALPPAPPSPPASPGSCPSRPQPRQTPQITALWDTVPPWPAVFWGMGRGWRYYLLGLCPRPLLVTEETGEGGAGRAGLRPGVRKGHGTLAGPGPRELVGHVSEWSGVTNALHHPGASSMHGRSHQPGLLPGACGLRAGLTYPNALGLLPDRTHPPCRTERTVSPGHSPTPTARRKRRHEARAEGADGVAGAGSSDAGRVPGAEGPDSRPRTPPSWCRELLRALKLCAWLTCVLSGPGRGTAM